MCGRYLITSPPEAIRALFRYPERPNFPPRYNVAPTQPVPIVRLDEGERRFALVRWGFIPSWVKDPHGFSLLINARADSLCEKPAFRYAVRRRRCLFPADGFYEWRRDGRRAQPFAVRPADGQPVAFAGLWETWTGPNGEEVDTAAIVTTEASAALVSIHPRMPAVIPPAAFDPWLDSLKADADEAMTLIRPAPVDLFRAYPVSDAVNRAANDSPDLIVPAPPGGEHDDAATLAGTSADAERSGARPRRARDDDAQGSLF